MQQVRDLFGAMKAEGKDFVTMEEFLAYYDSAKVGKNGELYAFRWRLPYKKTEQSILSNTVFYDSFRFRRLR